MFGQELRIRVPTKSGGRSKTQQAEKVNCDINRIVKHYTKYGVVPEGVTVKAARYADVSQVPTFQEAQNMIRHAEEIFLSVPLEIRRACDHNPAKVMDFINDPANADVLKKFGMLKPEKVEEPNYLKEIAENTKKEPVKPVAQ